MVFASLTPRLSIQWTVLVAVLGLQPFLDAVQMEAMCTFAPHYVNYTYTKVNISSLFSAHIRLCHEHPRY